MALSQRTVGLIGQAAAGFGHAVLSTELMKSGLAGGDPGQTDRAGRSIARNKRAAAAVKEALRQGKWDGLLTLADAVLNGHASHGDVPSWARELTVSLRADGFDAVADEIEEDTSDFWSPSPASRTWAIVPLGDEDMPLAASASALARDLDARGLDTAASHFEQAFDSLAAGQWESANSQLRTTFENVLVELTKKKFDWVGGGGGQALDVLRGKRALDDHEYSYLKGLWGMSHTNGSHPGLSSKTEAQLRMYAVVGAIRFVLHGMD